MAHPAIPDRVSFFYPIGNTPAVCLTKDIPREIPAKVLLLGCGDVRNVLYTCYVDRDTARPMDITCCDIQPAIIARNICLLSLVLDNKNPDKDNSIWDIYYHLYIDETALQILNVQAKNLVTASKSLQSWNESQYGSLFRFCDSGTFSRVVKIWSVYAASDKSARNIFSAKLKKDISNTASAKLAIIGSTDIASGFRSTSPAPLDQAEELVWLHREYLKHGTTSGTQPKEANPMFDSNGTLHYAMDPLFGFHLAPAYVPLAPASLFKVTTGTKSTAKVVDIARLEFATWCSAFKKSVSNVTLRFFAGDALAFCQALQHIAQSKSNTFAKCYRQQGCSEPLLLDNEDYGAGGSGPLMFTAIDTSNLVDHLSALNVLVATSPLLDSKTHATLFTEVLVRQEGTQTDAVNSLICGDFASMALLLGLMPVEYYTKATVTSSTSEAILSALSGGDFTPGKDQSLIRINWKRTLSAPDYDSLVPLSFEPSDLASLLYKVYLNLFPHESVSSMFSNGTSLHAMRRKMESVPIPHYHRGSFIDLVRLVGTRVSNDWHRVVDNLVSLIEQDKTLITGRSYIQELYTYLHLSGLYTVDTFKVSSGMSRTLNSEAGLTKWKSLPPIVCVTLKVPRSKLTIFTNQSAWRVGIHTLNGSLLDLNKQWQNQYGVLQFSFGSAIAKGRRYENDFKLVIEEDEQGWEGNSPLLASFLTPSWMFGLGRQSPLVSLGLQPSGQSSVMFGSSLGTNMNLYQTSLCDEANVFITADWPNLSATSPTTGLTHLLPLSQPTEKKIACIKLSAEIQQQTGSIKSLVGHADIFSTAIKIALRDGGKVEIEQMTPFQVSVIIAGQHRIHINFPVPVASVGRKIRIARKSSYIEVIAPLLRPDDHESFPAFMHPTFLEDGLPVLWNMSRVNLDGMASVDITDPNKLKWLHTHISLMWSHREGAMRIANISGKESPTRELRMDFKDGLFSMFMTFSGARDNAQKSFKARVFGLSNASSGGMQMIIVVSALRLDGAGGSILLDAAALPPTPAAGPKIASWMHRLGKGELVMVKVDDKELELWRSLLPAYAERCRTWSHKASCEYKARKSIPVTTERGESPLCSCGQGIFPANFSRDASTKKDLPQWNTLEKYATRVAISPSFSVPMVEKQFGADLFESSASARRPGTAEKSDPTIVKFQELTNTLGDGDLRAAFIARMKLKGDRSGHSLSDEDAIKKGVEEYMALSMDGCNKCGKEKQESGEALLKCAQCHKAKYCSSECQKAQWKEHKKICRKD